MTGFVAHIWCSCCELYKQPEEFSLRKDRPDKYHSWCKECIRDASRCWYRGHRTKRLRTMKRYQKKNLAKYAEATRLWRERHPEAATASLKKYYAAHPKEIAAGQKRRYKKNRKHILEYHVQYYKEHISKILAYMKAYHQKKSRIRKGDHYLVFKTFFLIHEIRHLLQGIIEVPARLSRGYHIDE